MNNNTLDETVSVDLGPRSYQIAITSGGLVNNGPDWIARWLERRLGRPVRRALIVADENVVEQHARPFVQALAKAAWECQLAIVPAGESSKSLDQLSQLYDHLIAMQADRSTVLVAMGGGVVGDAGGFAAATFVRGIPLIQIPTTLLSCVDSSVGGKTGINHAQAKNMIGAFYQPWGVLIDTNTFKSLPDREFRSGLAEVVKYGMILDEPFLSELEANVAEILQRDPVILRRIIARSCMLKAKVVEQDEFEQTGLRAILNYGHTFAHAYEALCGYGKLLHGEAVAIGMHDAALLACRIGRIDPQLVNRQLRLLNALGLATDLPAGASLSTDDVIERMRLDKKSVGRALRFVLPTRAGHVELVSTVDEADVRAVLSSRPGVVAG